MKKINRTHALLLSLLVMLILILEGKTACEGASEGIQICLKTIIPSLFPFFVITSYMNPHLMRTRIPGLTLLSRILKIPSGQESVLLLGLLGGYPVGAQLIGENYRNGILDKRNGVILMGFCSNAGPAFLFGIIGPLFQEPFAPWLLWLIHILSAIFTGLLLPRCTHQNTTIKEPEEIHLIQAFRGSLTICASVCGWIILYKAILAIAEKWLFSLLQGNSYIVFCGILELSNGCIQLSQISSTALRFILCTAFLSFGGLCVAMQTASVSAPLGMGLYIPGKLIQTILSVAFAFPLVTVLFGLEEIKFISWLLYALFAILSICLLRIYCRKKLWKLCQACGIM